MLNALKKLGQGFMDAQVTVALPHIAVVILGGLLGAAQAVNQTVLNLPSQWHAYLGLGLAVGGYLAVRPLVGTQFRDALPIPGWVTQILTVLVSVATVVIGSGLLPAGGLALAIVSTATTVLISLGFAPGSGSTVAQNAAQRRALKRAAPVRVTVRKVRGTTVAPS